MNHEQMQMEFVRKLPIPQEIKKQFPISEKIAQHKAERDEAIRRVFTGESDKFLLIIGPCSADSEEPVMEYIHRLARVQEKVADKIIMIPRIYTNKPRTTGKGYKGMLHQPDPEKQPDLLEGLIAIRKLHARAIEETGLTCADEMLYPENHRYLSDLLSYVAVGARSVEDQIHRLTGSGVGIPCGMKNPMSGDISVMLNSIEAAQSPQMFVYRGWESKHPAIHWPMLFSAVLSMNTATISRTTILRISAVSMTTMQKKALRIWPASLTPTTPTPASSTWHRFVSPTKSCTAAVTPMTSKSLSRAS